MNVRGTHVLLAYCPLVVLSFYATWLAGRISLGYWPRCTLDDPKSIKGFWMWTYHLTGYLFLAYPLIIIIAVVSVLRPAIVKSSDWRMRLAEAIAGTILLFLVFGFMQWDPHRIFEWYFD
jgi:hypothetical protein